MAANLETGGSALNARRHLWRQWPSWIVLLGLGLVSAGEARCFAQVTITAAAPVKADAAPAAPPPAKPPAAVPAAKAAPAATILWRARGVPAAAAAPKQAAPVRLKPVEKKGSLLGAIIGAMGGDNPDNPPVQNFDDQNIRNLEGQFRPQFQQLLYVELASLRRVCKPDVKQFADLAKTANAGLHTPLRGFASARWAAMQGRGASQTDEPHSEIRKLLMSLVEAKLSPEKARLYREDCDQRAEARKHAVVVNVVAELDRQLVLTAEQRAKLVKSLLVNFENSWDQYMEAFAFSNQNYLPTIRDESIVPLLDEKQKSIWEQATKLSRNVFFAQIVRGPLSGDATELQEIARIAEEPQDGK